MTEITTFATLKSEILALIGRAPIDAAYTMVTANINTGWRDPATGQVVFVRTLDMETKATLTSAASYVLPAAYLEMIDVYIASTPRRHLTPTSVAAINDVYASSGYAEQYAIEGTGANGTMIFDKAETADVLIRYYTEATALSADGDTNQILTKFPGIYLYGSLYHHSRLIRDQQAAADWGMQYASEINTANVFSYRERMRSGNPVRVTPRVVA